MTGKAKDDRIVPRSRIVKIEAHFHVPVNATRDEVMEWVCDALRCGSPISEDNPLYGYELEACPEPILTEMGVYLNTTAEKTSNGRYVVRSEVTHTPQIGAWGFDLVLAMAALDRARKREEGNE